MRNFTLYLTTLISLCFFVAMSTLSLEAQVVHDDGFHDHHDHHDQHDDPIFVNPGGGLEPGGEHDDPAGPGQDYGMEDREKCGTTEAEADSDWSLRLADIAEQLKDYEGSNERAGIITIPVVFHVIHGGEAIGYGKNLSVAQLQSQLDVLNEDFRKQNASLAVIIPPFANAPADCEIEFCLAVQDPNGAPTSGINRYNFGNNTWNPSSMAVQVQPGTVWNSANYLNVWTADLAGSNYLAYARYPGGNPLIDGIVLDYRITGRAPHNPLAYTASLGRYPDGHIGTHEVGHWLGLRHTFENGCGNPLYCYATGDFICDTPAKSSPTRGCNQWTYQCGGLTQISNYMDYADDACTAMFSQGQKNVMRAVLNGARASIQSSPACNPVCGVPGALAAANVTHNSATLTWNAVANANAYNVQYRLFAGGPHPWNNVAAIGNAVNVSGLAAFTPYEFRVQAACQNGNGAWSAPFLFWTQSATWNCAFDPYENMVFLPPMQNNVPVNGVICPQGDIDQHLIMNAAHNGTITVTLDQLPADYDLELYMSNTQNFLAGSYNAGLQMEQVSHANASAGYYYAVVRSTTGQWNNAQYYRLTMVITPPPPNGRTASRNALPDWLDELKVFPNPASEELRLTFNNSDSREVLEMAIIDINGSMIKNVAEPLYPGVNDIRLDVADLSPGSYFIRLDEENEGGMVQVIIQR